MGDPIEANAAGEIFESKQGEDVVVGSVKGNIGYANMLSVNLIIAHVSVGILNQPHFSLPLLKHVSFSNIRQFPRP